MIKMIVNPGGTKAHRQPLKHDRLRGFGAQETRPCGWWAVAVGWVSLLGLDW